MTLVSAMRRQIGTPVVVGHTPDPIKIQAYAFVNGGTRINRICESVAKSFLWFVLQSNGGCEVETSADAVNQLCFVTFHSFFSVLF